jgi:G2/mitotic-specific cyclin-B, other
MNISNHTNIFQFYLEMKIDQHLNISTIAQTMHCFDYLCSKMTILRCDLALVASTCLYLISKIHEIYPPTMETLMLHTNFVYSKSDLFTMEKHILSILHFQLQSPSRLQIIEMFNQFFQLRDKQRSLATYLIMLSYLEFEFNYYRMSIVAAAAIYVTLQVIDR